MFTIFVIEKKTRPNNIILLSLFYLYIKIYSKQGWTFYITNVKDE